MAIRNIREDGDPILRKKARPVTEFNDRLFELLDDMAETMYEAPGVGLAGPQVGVLRRIFVLNTLEEGKEGKENYLVFINPEIIAKMGEQEGVEGCLSIVGHEYFVKRPQKVAVKALDKDGNEFIWEAEDLMARAVCHESDHLDGKTIKDTCEYEIFPEEDEE